MATKLDMTMEEALERAQHAAPKGWSGGTFPQIHVGELVVHTHRLSGLVCRGESDDVLVRVYVPFTRDSGQNIEDSFENYILYGDGREFPAWRMP
jgi:hypothetical protein